MSSGYLIAEQDPRKSYAEHEWDILEEGIRSKAEALEDAEIRKSTHPSHIVEVWVEVTYDRFICRC